MSKTLVLVRGVSGAGKSTFAETVLRGCVQLEADMYFMGGDEYFFDPSKLQNAHKWCQSETERLMKSEVDVAVCNTFTTEWEMKPYLDLAEKYNYTVFTLVLENRHGSVDIHNVPEETRKKQAERLSKNIKLI